MRPGSAQPRVSELLRRGIVKKNKPGSKWDIIQTEIAKKALESGLFPEIKQMKKIILKCILCIIKLDYRNNNRWVCPKCGIIILAEIEEIRNIDIIAGDLIF